jgi:RsiW-degrading membrane proteinase PrsW (M82 family)
MHLNSDQLQALIRLSLFFTEAVLTAVLIAWLRWRQKGPGDKWSFMFRLLFLGGAVALVCGVVELRYSIRLADLPNDLTTHYQWYNVINFASSALVEEVAKYAAIILVISFYPRTNKASDILLFAILIGLGFSLVEDVLYFIVPDTIAPYRLLSFFMHAGTAAIMGGGLVRYLVQKEPYSVVVKSILSVITLHFIYNFASQLEHPVATWIVSGFIIAYFSTQIIILFKMALPLDGARAA